MQDNTSLDPKIIQGLLNHTKMLMNHVYWFQHHLYFNPQRQHFGSSINYIDIKSREEDFLRELINTIVGWIYGKSNARAIIDERLQIVENDHQNAAAFITTQAFSKFRPGLPQGQFGELLLFNFLQHFFQAVPLLRKMRITTSIGHERFGADAIHIKADGDKIKIFLGESKCYESKYQFNKAFSASLESIINTFQTFDSELGLYTYDDFIEPELEEIAKKYKRGELKGVQFELVCLVAYNETNSIDGSTENEIKESIKRIICERCQAIDKDLFRELDSRVLNRINYIIFPIWKLDSLLDKFSNLIGGN